jgi:hypothetical protein
MDFDSLIALAEKKERRQNSLNEFKTRVKTREAQFTAKSKSLAPTEKFFARSYNL